LKIATQSAVNRQLLTFFDKRPTAIESRPSVIANLPFDQPFLPAATPKTLAAWK